MSPFLERLEMGPDVAALLRPEEAAELRRLRDTEPLRCVVCGRPIEPASEDVASVQLSPHGHTARAEFTHRDCAPSHAELSRLVVMAQAEPLGIDYAEALHPSAGAVLLWERRLDVRVRARADRETLPYLDAHRADGFHPALGDEPVHGLEGIWLERDDGDLVLRGGVAGGERFRDALARPTPGWWEALTASGFALLIVGAGLALDHPRPQAVQAAIRNGRALMGLVELHP